MWTLVTIAVYAEKTLCTSFLNTEIKQFNIKEHSHLELH